MQATIAHGAGWSEPTAPKSKSTTKRIITIVVTVVGAILLVLALAAAALVAAVGRGMNDLNLDNAPIAAATNEAGSNAFVVAIQGANGDQCYTLVSDEQVRMASDHPCRPVPKANEVQAIPTLEGVLFGGAGSNVSKVVVTFADGQQLAAQTRPGAVADARTWVVNKSGNANVKSIVGYDRSGQPVSLAAHPG